MAESTSLSLCAHIIILIELFPRAGSDQQDRINRLRLETFGLIRRERMRADRLDEPTGINKKRLKDVLESGETNNTITLVVPFSKAGNCL